MPNNQVKALIAYCVVMLGLTQFLQHSHVSHDRIDAIAALFGALLPLAISVFAIRNGWALGTMRRIDRADSPVGYWLLVAMGFGVGGYLLLQGLTGLLSPQ